MKYIGITVAEFDDSPFGPGEARIEASFEVGDNTSLARIEGEGQALNFSEALVLMRLGHKVRRAAWGAAWSMGINGGRLRSFHDGKSHISQMADDLSEEAILATDWEVIHG